MKVKEIAALIEREAPRDLAYDWDNVGLLIGSGESEVKKIFITLDVNLATAKEAAAAGCDMIVSHHPILFRGIKRIDYDTPCGEMLRILIENKISVYAAHTNMDTAPGGINFRLAEIFGLEDVKILEYHTDSTDAGLGRYGRLKKALTADELCQTIKEKLHTPSVRAAGDMNKEIKSLCVASGSCSESIETAIAKGCDAVITGDLRYHETMDFAEQGIFIIDAGHYPTEIMVTDIFEEILSESGVETVKSKNKDTFRFV